MGIADRLNELKSKAVDATVEHSDKIQEAVEKVASTADQRTGGKYHERLEQAGAKAGSLLDSLKGAPEAGAESAGSSTTDAGAAPATDASPAADTTPKPGADVPAP
jgi:MT0933-like antitoxin protein